MPIKLKTSATKVAPVTANPEAQTVAELVDKVGTLEADALLIAKQIKALQEKLKPYKAAVKELQEHVDTLELDDDATTELRGTVYRVEVGKRGTSRSIIDLPKVFEFMGEDVFTQVATVPLKAIDDYLTPPQKEQVLKIDRTDRTFKFVELPKD